MKIGLFFGSFNPIHIGHLIIVNYILNQTDLKKIWLVVSPLNPFKTDDSLLNEYHRLGLVKKAVENDDRIIASKIEFQLPKPSYTVNTLTYLKENHAEDEFSVIMGSDGFQDLDKWKNFETIINNHKIWIYCRSGFEVENKINAEIEIVQAPLLNISSTEIRQLIKKGKSIRYLVPEKVREEIEKNQYYKE
jgi:nicotinate-nucleotide adenylyltransferase